MAAKRTFKARTFKGRYLAARYAADTGSSGGGGGGTTSRHLAKYQQMLQPAFLIRR